VTASAVLFLLCVCLFAKLQENINSYPHKTIRIHRKLTAGLRHYIPGQSQDSGAKKMLQSELATPPSEYC